MRKISIPRAAVLGTTAWGYAKYAWPLIDAGLEQLQRDDIIMMVADTLHKEAKRKP